MPDARDLRTIFDTVAARYDGIRPHYPRELVDELVALAGLGPGRRVLEIGCGTGQLTRPLAATGARVTAVELGGELAAVARRHLAPFPDADVVVGAFEDAHLPWAAFDLVVAATAWHWIDRDVRTAKAARLLRRGGVLAVLDTQHVSADGTSRFFADAQRCYEAWDPQTPPNLPPSTLDGFATVHPELDAATDFGPVDLRRRVHDITYTAAEYRELLLTYSGHLALPARDRDGLLDCLTTLIERDHGGAVTKRYLFELWTTARR